jgi:hypothetical protein
VRPPLRGVVPIEPGVFPPREMLPRESDAELVPTDPLPPEIDRGSVREEGPRVAPEELPDPPALR